MGSDGSRRGVSESRTERGVDARDGDGRKSAAVGVPYSPKAAFDSGEETASERLSRGVVRATTGISDGQLSVG